MASAPRRRRPSPSLGDALGRQRHGGVDRVRFIAGVLFVVAMYEALKQDTDASTALRSPRLSCDKQMATLRMVSENILVTPLMIALSHVFIVGLLPRDAGALRRDVSPALRRRPSCRSCPSCSS